MRHAVYLLYALLLWPRIARAGNDDELLAGHQAAMMGGAVSAFVADSSAIWYDPAGLGAITRDQIDVSATVYTLRFYSAPGLISSTSGATDDGQVSEFVSIPTQIAYVRALAPRLNLGLGYFVPQATNLMLREQLRVTDDSAPSVWQVAIANASTLHNAAAALGFALTPRVRFGVGLIGSYQAQSQAASLFAAIGSEQATSQLLSATSLSTGTRVGLELALGLQLDLSSAFKLGLSMRSPRLQLFRSIDGVASVGTGMVQSGSDPQLNGTISEPRGSGHVALLRAGRYGLSLAYEYGRDRRVCIEGDVQPALRDDAQAVRRSSVVNARLGVYHALASGLAVGAGLFTDRSPDVLDDSPGNNRSDFYGATLGLEISNEHWLAERERATSLIFSSVFALRYAYSNGEMSRFLVDPAEPSSLLLSSSLGTLVAHELGLYVGSGLTF
jgi:hypothetical protein